MFNTKQGDIHSFEHTHYYTGFSAYLITSDGLHVVLTCPTMDLLEMAWDRATGKRLPLNKSRVLETATCQKDNLRPSDVDMPVWEDLNRIVWVIQNESAKSQFCIMKRMNDLFKSDEVLGDAIRRTRAECEILLRRKGYDEKQRQRMNIQTFDPDDDIPF